ncbi:TetR/AcrR family transcriptional regulator [Brevibacillus fluminis]|uniref:TetR/AcrR family transcriptional regulator n=1 Tax=Brevibacillus fluminis TaxID=511487 RepID=UPI003F8BF7D4
MPKFTEQEKERVRESLLVKGKELFIQYGLAKTSIDDIILACGIGKGTFYKFFASKEELYYAILKNEEEVRKLLIGKLLGESLSPKELLTSFFIASFRYADENPFFQRVFQDGEHERLVRKLPKHLAEELAYEDTAKGIEAVQALMHKGILPKQDPAVVVGIMKAVMLLRFHKDKIGEPLFDQVIEKIIDYVTDGMIKDTRE